MNIQEIDKWLDNEYGCSYTRLEELHDYFFEKYTEQKEEIERLKNGCKELEQEIDRLGKLFYERNEENIRLNNIINELEKWLVEWREMLDYPGFYEKGIIDCINDTLTKLQELKEKGEMKNDKRSNN